MITIFDVPRIDRAAIMARAEEITRINPTFSVAIALFYAGRDYENGDLHAGEPALLDAVIEDPASLMKPAPKRRLFGGRR